MNTSDPKQDQPVRPFDDESKFTPAYHGSKVPWQIHLMWALFAIASIIYLVRLGIPDFIRWW